MRDLRLQFIFGRRLPFWAETGKCIKSIIEWTFSVNKTIRSKHLKGFFAYAAALYSYLLDSISLLPSAFSLLILKRSSVKVELLSVIPHSINLSFNRPYSKTTIFFFWIFFLALRFFLTRRVECFLLTNYQCLLYFLHFLLMSFCRFLLQLFVFHTRSICTRATELLLTRFFVN